MTDEDEGWVSKNGQIGYQFGEVVYAHVREPLCVWVRPGRSYIDSDEHERDVVAFDVSAERYKKVLEAFVRASGQGDDGKALRCWLAVDAIRQRYRELVHDNPELERAAMQSTLRRGWLDAQTLGYLIHEDVAQAYAGMLTPEQREAALSGWMAFGCWDLDVEEYNPDPAMLTFMRAAHPDHADNVGTLETLIHDAAQGCMQQPDKAREFLRTFFAKRDTESLELPDLG